MQKLLRIFVVLTFCLALCGCKSPIVSISRETESTLNSMDQATAMISCTGAPFVVENAEGMVYTSRIDAQNTMVVYDEIFEPGFELDTTLLTDASDCFIFRVETTENPYLTAYTYRKDGENYYYRVEGTGIQEVTMGIDGLFVVGESADCRLDAFVFGELDHSITLYCKGDQISLVPDGDLLYVEGVEEELEITLTRGFGTSKRCAITIPGGSGTLDVSSMIADEIAVIAEDGTRTEYHIFFQ